MTRRLFLALSALLLGLILPPVRAQEPPPDVRLRFLFLDETDGAYSLKTGDTYRRLTTTPYAISPPVLAKPHTQLEIFKDSATPDPVTGKPVRLKAATVTVPAGTPRSLVVIAPRPAPADPAAAPAWDVAFFNSDPQTFPAKSIRILNLDHVAMAARFGSVHAIVQPGESCILQPDTDRRNRVFARIAVAAGAGWKLLYDNVTILRPGERLTGIFVYSPSGLRYTYTEGELEDRGPPPPGHFWLTYSDTP